MNNIEIKECLDIVNIDENGIVITLNKQYPFGKDVAKDIESQLSSDNELEVENWDAFYDNYVL